MESRFPAWGDLLRCQLTRMEENGRCRRTLWQRHDLALTHLPPMLSVSPEAGARHATMYTVMVAPDRCGMGSTMRFRTR